SFARHRIPAALHSCWLPMVSFIYWYHLNPSLICRSDTRFGLLVSPANVSDYRFLHGRRLYYFPFSHHIHEVLFSCQAYMFFGLLAVALLIDFLWCGHFRTLYLFTLA